jgi:hypothetical protein
MIEPEDEPKKKKARKGRANRKEWVITKNQRKRQEGVAYKGLGKTESGTWKYTIPRAERKLNPRCHCALIKKKSKIQCNEFSEDRRERIFKEFWKLTWHEKKVFVNMLMDTKNPRETKNKQNEISRLKVSLFFYLKKDGIRIRVCKKMFLNTLDLKQWSVLHWVQSQSNGRVNDTEKKWRRDYLNMLPKVESHYCRSSTDKLYLEPIWRTKTNVFREYEKYCPEKNTESLGYKVFEDIFNELNLSIFMPKKDQCDVCIRFNTNNVSQEQYDLHQKRKVEARQQKDHDKIYRIN